MSRHLQRQHSAEHCWIQQPLRDLISSFSWKCSSFHAVSEWDGLCRRLCIPPSSQVGSTKVGFDSVPARYVAMPLLVIQAVLAARDLVNLQHFLRPWNIRFGWPSSFFTIGFCCSKLQLRLQLSWHHSFESNSSLSLLVAISESRSRVVISRAWNHTFAVNPQYPRNLIDRNTFFQGSLRTAPITRCLCWTRQNDNLLKLTIRKVVKLWIWNRGTSQILPSIFAI